MGIMLIQNHLAVQEASTRIYCFCSSAYQHCSLMFVCLLHSEFPFLDRISLRLAGGQLLGYTFMSETGAQQPGEDGQKEYEFSNFEENFLRMFIDALRVAGVAILFEASSNVLRGIQSSGMDIRGHWHRQRSVRGALNPLSASSCSSICV